VIDGHQQQAHPAGRPLLTANVVRPAGDGGPRPTGDLSSTEPPAAGLRALPASWKSSFALLLKSAAARVEAPAADPDRIRKRLVGARSCPVSIRTNPMSGGAGARLPGFRDSPPEFSVDAVRPATKKSERNLGAGPGGGRALGELTGVNRLRQVLRPGPSHAIAGFRGRIASDIALAPPFMLRGTSASSPWGPHVIALRA